MISLFVSALFYLYWGFRLYNLETMSAFHLSGMILGYSILAAIILLGFSAFSSVALKRPADKTVTGSYAVMLLVAMVGHAYVAYKAPQVKSTFKISNRYRYDKQRVSFSVF